MYHPVANRFKKLLYVQKWYIKNGLYHPVTLLLLVLSIIFYFLAIKYQEEPYRTTTVRPLLEYVIIPLYALSTALLVQSRSQEIVFEVNLFKNWHLIYIGKILAFIFSLTPLIAGLMAINVITGYTAVKTASLAMRILTISMIISISIAIKNPRAGHLFLLSSLLILPLSALVVVSAIIRIGEKINPLLSIVSYMLSPINMEAYIECMDISYNILLTSVVSIVLVVIALFMYIFKHQEYTLD